MYIRPVCLKKTYVGKFNLPYFDVMMTSLFENGLHYELIKETLCFRTLISMNLHFILPLIWYITRHTFKICSKIWIFHCRPM